MATVKGLPHPSCANALPSYRLTEIDDTSINTGYEWVVTHVARGLIVEYPIAPHP